jgi:hypothetical protein
MSMISSRHLPVAVLPGSLKRYRTVGLWMVIVAALFLLAGCRQRSPRMVTRAFYYWKSVFALSELEESDLKTLQVPTLYVKMFDVTWSLEAVAAIPVAQIQFKDKSYRHFNIIPVVFITNETLVHTDSNAIEGLANKICSLLTSTIRQNDLKPPAEIQFDCDWTASTRATYFHLLHEARIRLNKAGFRSATISATIRLFQCKYISKTGVPPVDKGLLMCYNMGNLTRPRTGNSILETTELKKYIASVKTYPLPLDIALPIFDWKVLFHEGSYAGLVKDLPDSLLRCCPSVTQQGNRCTFLKDTSVLLYSFKAGDVLRDEQSRYDEITTAGNMISTCLTDQKVKVILYHLDSLTLVKYSVNEMENMFNSLQ